ncbi:hypothetical protein BgiMline_036514 [Biomphalaria glabrata]|uniref:Uncharacterized protein LOC106063660 n=1 Tax=Biomphalaria glabrata TaxID=6526 RepID=A0A9U8E8U4_BIOGL|nr:uncharacterized protein LOC106063660 [Biomphalaria glabrata]XP_055872614.1 uncharacterized protein LOC106063660 [Biomphalaria glabrata]
MTKSLLYLMLCVWSVSSRYVQNKGNFTQYECLTDQSCDDYDNLKMFNHKIYCCKPSHSIIFKMEITQPDANFESWQELDELQNTEHGSKDFEDERNSVERENEANMKSPDVVPYSVVEEQREHNDNWKRPDSEDEHFPTTLYLDLKEAPRQLSKRDLALKEAAEMFPIRVPTERLNSEKRLRLAEPRSHQSSRTTTTCVCDSGSPESFMGFLMGILRSLCSKGIF